MSRNSTPLPAYSRPRVDSNVSFTSQTSSTFRFSIKRRAVQSLQFLGKDAPPRRDKSNAAHLSVSAQAAEGSSKPSAWRKSLAAIGIKKQPVRRVSAPAVDVSYAERREAERKELVDAEAEAAAAAAKGKKAQRRLMRFMGTDDEVSLTLAEMYAAESTAQRERFDRSHPPPATPVSKRATAAAAVPGRWMHQRKTGDDEIEEMLLYPAHHAARTEPKKSKKSKRAANHHGLGETVSEEDAVWQELQWKVCAEHMMF